MVANFFASRIFQDAILNAQKRIRNIGFEMNKATKELGAKQKQINSYKRAQTNAIRQEHANGISSGAIDKLIQDNGGDLVNSIFKNGVLDRDAAAANQTAFTQYQNMYSQVKLMANNDMQRSLEQLEEEIEMMTQTELEPLHDYENDLKVEMDLAKNQLEVAKGAKETADKMQQENIKGMFA